MTKIDKNYQNDQNDQNVEPAEYVEHLNSNGEEKRKWIFLLAGRRRSSIGSFVTWYEEECMKFAAVIDWAVRA